jgi:hypothetical protein
MNEALSPELETERIRVWTRLSEIFSPHTIELRRKLFNYPKDHENPTARFVHYTSAEAGISIIQSQRLWMRNTMCMSDYREVQHGFDNFHSFFAMQPNEANFLAALDKCFPGIGKEAFAIFNKWLTDIRTNTYITSLSEHDTSEDIPGRLSMWRAFGSDSARVAIVLKTKWRSDTGIRLRLTVSPVTYLAKNAVHEMLLEVIENVQRHCDFLQSLGKQQVLNYLVHMLMTEVVCHKHEGFREEKEWRAIYAPARLPSDVIQSDVRVISGVPQVIYKIPLEGEFHLKDLLDRIIIGPTQYSLAIAQALITELLKIGVSDAANRVFMSDIPIRT